MELRRVYREGLKTAGLTSFVVSEGETDLYVVATADLTAEVSQAISLYRSHITNYLALDPDFARSLEPLAAATDAPEIIKHMCRAARLTGVGPMAAVAGAIAHYVANDIMTISEELIIENGGDIFINSNEDRLVQIYAGGSPLSNKVALRLRADDLPLGVCTSSGTVGHSLSFGQADAAVVVARDTVLADAAATKLGNLINSREDIETSLEQIMTIEGVLGALVIFQDHLGLIGELELVKL